MVVNRELHKLTTLLMDMIVGKLKSFGKIGRLGNTIHHVGDRYTNIWLRTPLKRGLHTGAIHLCWGTGDDSRHYNDIRRNVNAGIVQLRDWLKAKS